MCTETPDTHMFVSATVDAAKVLSDARARSDKGEVILIHYHSSRRWCAYQATLEGLRAPLEDILRGIVEMAGREDNLPKMLADGVIMFLEMRDQTGSEFQHVLFVDGVQVGSPTGPKIGP
jgi:hypothetical protein